MTDIPDYEPKLTVKTLIEILGKLNPEADAVDCLNSNELKDNGKYWALQVDVRYTSEQGFI